MRTLLGLSIALSLTAIACGSSQSEPTGGGSGGGSGGSEPIVIDPPPAAAGQVVVGTDACATDADCVPAGCCHAAACVATANAPACGEVMCTTECRFGTLDCGGSCLCQDGHCAARLSQAPDIHVEGSTPQ